jgi:hypothetical protein
MDEIECDSSYVGPFSGDEIQREMTINVASTQPGDLIHSLTVETFQTGFKYVGDGISLIGAAFMDKILSIVFKSMRNPGVQSPNSARSTLGPSFAEFPSRASDSSSKACGGS